MVMELLNMIMIDLIIMVVKFIDFITYSLVMVQVKIIMVIIKLHLFPNIITIIIKIH